MRYFTVTYYRKSDGRMDESVKVRSSINANHYSTCGVIVDFKLRKVLKASVEGSAVALDFDRIVSYYFQYYKTMINDLAGHYGYQLAMDDVDRAQEEKNVSG